MRKNLKSLAPTLWFVIVAFIISIFAVWGGAGRLGEGRDANVIATVGKEKFTAELYMESLRSRLESLKREFKTLDSNFIQQLNIPQQVLEQNIQRMLLLQVASDYGIKVSAEELRVKIISYPVFQKEGKFIGFQEYKKILDWNRIPLEQFEDNLEKEIQIDKIINLLTAGIAVSEEEIWTAYKDKNEFAKLEYVLAESEKMEIDTDFTPDQMKEFFESHRDDFNVSEKREGDYVFFDNDISKKEIEVAESDINRYYKDNEPQFTEPEKTQVSRIYLPYADREKPAVEEEARGIAQKIAEGEDFGGLAKVHSRDEKAEDSGDWGMFEWRRLSISEQEAVEELAQGEVSEPITLDDGLVILKATLKEDPFLKPLEEVRERVSDILKDQQANDIIEKKILKLEKTAKREKSLESAAQKLGYAIAATGLLKEGDSIAEIDPSGSIASALHQLEESGVSSPIYTYKGVGLAQLKTIAPPRPAQYEEVEEEVRSALTDQMKADKAQEIIETIMAESARRPLESLAEKYGLEYKTVEEHKRGQYLSVIGENTQIDELAFSHPLNEISSPVAFEGGVTLLRFLERKEVTRDAFAENRDTEREALLESKKNKVYQSMLTQIRGEKEVKIKYDLFLKLNNDILSRFDSEG